MKILFFLLLMVSCVVAKSYRFSETRYSDALEKSMQLRGTISFGDESLEILYDTNSNRLVYEDEELSMYEGEETIELDASESLKIAQYFDIIILLYEGDEEKLSHQFMVQKEDTQTLLFPKNEMKNYIQKIRLTHDKESLKSLKLFLSNDDTIKISIEDEVL